MDEMQEDPSRVEELWVRGVYLSLLRVTMPQIKGLSTFIADIRSCPSHDLEEKRVGKEIAKIRQVQ